MMKTGNFMRVMALFVSAIAYSAIADEDGVVTRSYSNESDSAPIAQGLPSSREVQVCAPAPYYGTMPFAFAIAPAIEAPSQEWDVAVVRLSLLAGRHRAMYGLDLGILGNITDYEMNGLALGGLFNSVGESTGAVQIALLVNFAAFDFSGCQIAALYSATEGTMTGLQLGAANYAGKLSGIQFGLYNFAETLNGLQIGVINLNKSSSVQFMPILNFGF